MTTSYYDFFILINDKYKNSSARANCAGFLYETSKDLSESLNKTGAKITINTGQQKKDIAIHNEFIKVLAGKDKNSDPDLVIIQVFNDLLADDYQLPDDADKITAQIMTIGFFYSVFVDEKLNTNLLMLLNHPAMMLCKAIGKIIAHSPDYATDQVKHIKSNATIQENKQYVEEEVLKIYDKDQTMPGLSRRGQCSIIEKRLPYKTNVKTGKKKKIAKYRNINDILNKYKKPYVRKT